MSDAKSGSLVPLPVCSDGLVTIRPLSLDDAVAWNAGDDDEQRRWFEAPGPSTVVGVRWVIARWQASWQAGGPVFHFGVREALTDVLAGGVELRVRDDGRANLSYVIFPAFRRRGYARRAMELACGYAREALGAPAVVAIIHEENAASRAVALAAGFALDGLAEPWEYSESGVILRYLRHIAVAVVEPQA